jgi:hypothetical protein
MRRTISETPYPVLIAKKGQEVSPPGAQTDTTLRNGQIGDGERCPVLKIASSRQR